MSKTKPLPRYMLHKDGTVYILDENAIAERPDVVREISYDEAQRRLNGEVINPTIIDPSVIAPPPVATTGQFSEAGSRTATEEPPKPADGIVPQNFLDESLAAIFKTINDARDYDELESVVAPFNVAVNRERKSIDLAKADARAAVVAVFTQV